MIHLLTTSKQFVQGFVVCQGHDSDVIIIYTEVKCWGKNEVTLHYTTCRCVLLWDAVINKEFLTVYSYNIKGSATEVSTNLQKFDHVLFCDSWSGFASSSYLSGRHRR